MLIIGNIFIVITKVEREHCRNKDDIVDKITRVLDMKLRVWYHVSDYIYM